MSVCGINGQPALIAHVVGCSTHSPCSCPPFSPPSPPRPTRTLRPSVTFSSAAPGAAIEVLTNKASELINSESSSADNPSSSTGASTGSVTNTLSQVQAQASSLASTASERAAGLSQAATEKLSGLVDQAKQNLPPQVASLLPGGVGVGSGAAAAASGTASSGLSTGDIVHQEPQHDITSQTRETTSAPIVESQQEDRATSVSKPLVPGSSGPAPTATSSSFSSTSSSAPGISQVGVVRDDTNTDITEAHTTGTFAATGKRERDVEE